MKKFSFTILLIMFILPAIFGGESFNDKLIKFTKQKCIENNTPFLYILAIGVNESNFLNVRSNKNTNGSYDIGIMQLNSNYIQYYEETFWYKEEDFNPWNPYHNIEMSILYLKHLYNYTKDWSKAISAYNTGLHGLKKYPDIAERYLHKIIEIKVLLMKGDYFD